MTSRLRERVEVATCIGCGARSRLGDCASGCTDVPLELVEAAEIDALDADLDALQQRSAALRSVAKAFADDPDADWDELRRAGRDALARPRPPERGPAAVIPAWGCPDCGRIDAPQPCIEVCVRRPVLMADAADYRERSAAFAHARDDERDATDVVRLIVNVRARSGAEEETKEALRRRARAGPP